MNNTVDFITLLTTDVFTVNVWIIISVIIVTPQVIIKSGYTISSLLYNCFWILDDCLVSNKFTTETPRDNDFPPQPIVNEENEPGCCDGCYFV
jgi:hypothetical protein